MPLLSPEFKHGYYMYITFIVMIADHLNGVLMGVKFKFVALYCNPTDIDVFFYLSFQFLQT